MKARNILSLTLRIVAAVIMLQTLYFKFTGAPESIYIFSQVGIEPWGRIATGVAELIASVLLLIPATIVVGALLSIGVMLGAVATHLFILGIEVQGDGGQLFAYALIVLVASGVLVAMHYRRLVEYKEWLVKTK
jgi:uncharacterized membrane protein YphA (DoxX/SURF4 family)